MNGRTALGVLSLTLLLASCGQPTSTASTPSAPSQREHAQAPILGQDNPDAIPDQYIVVLSDGADSGNNISSALGDLPGPLCITTLATANLGAGPDFPVNVTNAYTEDDTDNTSCVPVLGEECVRALLSTDGRAVMPPSSGGRG